MVKNQYTLKSGEKLMLIPKGRTVYDWTDLLFIGEELGYDWNAAHDIVNWCNPTFHSTGTYGIEREDLEYRDEDSQKIVGEFFKRIGNPDTVELIG